MGRERGRNELSKGRREGNGSKHRDEKSLVCEALEIDLVSLDVFANSVSCHDYLFLKLLC